MWLAQDVSNKSIRHTTFPEKLIFSGFSPRWGTISSLDPRRRWRRSFIFQWMRSLTFLTPGQICDRTSSWLRNFLKQKTLHYLTGDFIGEHPGFHIRLWRRDWEGLQNIDVFDCLSNWLLEAWGNERASRYNKMRLYYITIWNERNPECQTEEGTNEGNH